MTGDRGFKPVDPTADLQAPSERAIVDRARRGDREAVGMLYDLYLTPIFRYVAGRVSGPSEAEDITEEVFLRVIEYIGRFEWQPNVPFRAWLFRIAHNQIITHHRKHGSHGTTVSTELFEIEDRQPGPEWLAEQKLATREVFVACEKLPSSQREVIALRFGSGLSVRETAEALGKTENNVKVLQHKAIAKLQKLLKD